MQNKLIEQTKKDLLVDFENARFIASGYSANLVPSTTEFPRQLETIRNHITNIEESCKKMSSEIDKIQSVDEAVFAITNKSAITYALHELSLLSGAFRVSPNWESPSFSASLKSQSGNHEGKIRQAMNDYTRDQHIEGNLYAQAFLNEYVDHFPTLLVKAFAVSSGMAALTTILHFLRGEHNATDIVFVGKGSYFENKLLIEKFANQVILFDEYDIPDLLKLLSLHKPRAIFFDALGNNPDITAPDIQGIFDAVNKFAHEKTFVVLDNTGRSVTFQPFASSLFKHGKMNVICFESLNKYHQFGLDRVTGGIIYSLADRDILLYDYRDHAGTNISDIAAASLPTPNKKILLNRLVRHERNAQFISEKIESNVKRSNPKALEKVHYPGLVTHAKDIQQTFHGSIITLQFKKEFRTVRFYSSVVSNLIKEAKKRNLSLIGGTSFGLSTTRVYVPASRPGQGTPFFRIAVGTETQLEIEALLDVFQTVLL